MYSLLSKGMSDSLIAGIGAALLFLVTYFCLRKPFGFLPSDRGKVVTTVDGKKMDINGKSAGKTTGVGLVFVCILLLGCIVFLPINLELILNLFLVLIMMVVGYLDDTAKTPWNEYVKGALDLVIALAAVIVFVIFNGTDVSFFGISFHMNTVLYVILGVVLIWASINVTNCSDGVDGLCGGVSAIEMAAFMIIFHSNLREYRYMTALFIAVLVAYLRFNWYPSTVLMGDAGSRAIGFFLALLSMHSGHPFIFVLLSLVFILDGGLGLIKVSLKRFLKIVIFANTQMPLHDHFIKQKKMERPKTSAMFIFAEAIVAVVTGVLLLIFA